MEELNLEDYQKTIPSIYKDVPVELLCDLLSINTEWQIKNMQDDPILKFHVTKKANPEVFGDNRQRIHLDKEGFIIWVLGLDYKFLSDEKQPIFIRYKMNLLKYILQITIEREEFMLLKAQKEVRIKELETKLNDDTDYIELMELRASVARIGKSIIGLDRSSNTQLMLFSSADFNKK